MIEIKKKVYLRNVPTTPEWSFSTIIEPRQGCVLSSLLFSVVLDETAKKAKKNYYINLVQEPKKQTKENKWQISDIQKHFRTTSNVYQLTNFTIERYEDRHQ